MAPCHETTRGEVRLMECPKCKATKMQHRFTLHPITHCMKCDTHYDDETGEILADKKEVSKDD